MPKVAPIQTSFNSGEFSPLVHGRVDSDRYKTALAKCFNFIPTIQGGLTRRGGSMYVSETKTSSKESRLIPFEFSVTQAYMLEFGDQYIRFYKDRGLITEAPKTITGITQANPAVVTSVAHGFSNGDRVIISGVLGMVEVNNREFLVANVAANTFELQTVGAVNVNSTGYGAYTSGGTASEVYEIASPYLEAQLFQVKYTQSADVLYLVHPSHKPRKLTRTGHTSWTLSTITFLDGPYLPTNTDLNLTMTPSVFAVGATGTLQTGPANPLTNAVDNGSGLIRITTTNPHGKVTGDLTAVADVTGTTEANGDWVVTVINATTLDLQGSAFVNAYTGGGGILPVVFRSTDVGRYVRMREGSWGYALITGYINYGRVNIEVKVSLTTTNPRTAWRLGVWSDTTGYPSTVTFHEDRLFFAGASIAPQRLDGSRSGDYENFAPTDTDASATVTASHAVSFSLNSNDVNLIRWLTSDEKGMLVGTVGGEWVVKASAQNEGLSPTNISAKRTTSYGSQNMQPVQAGKATLFAQRGGKKIREMSYFFDVDGFRAADLTLLSEHITGDGVVQMAYQKIPQSIAWIAREDGALLGLTYERDPDSFKVGWHRHELGGTSDASGSISKAESLSVIPSPDGTSEDLWVITKRYINGQTKRYVEYITKIFEEQDLQQDAFFVDSGLTYDVPLNITAATQANPVQLTVTAHGLSNGDKILIQDVSGMTELNTNTYIVSGAAANTFNLTAQNGGSGNVNGTGFNAYITGGTVRKMVSTISGLTHLEGETVSILADGAVRPNVVVTNSKITLDSSAAIVQIGYGYNSDMQMLRIEAGSADGTALGKTRRTNRVGALLHRTLGLKIGMSESTLTQITFRKTSDPMTRAPGLFSGIISEIVDADYDLENQIFIRQGQPLPCTILAVMPIMTTYDRS